MSTISAGTTSGTTLVATGDTAGTLVFKTNDTGSGGTTALTLATNQNATFAGSIVSPTITSPTITSPTISGTPVLGATLLTSGTAVASTSGTSIDFTGLPSWVKRIVVMFNAVSLSGNSTFRIQLGTGATPTYTTSGYVTFGVTFSASGLGAATDTGGFPIGQNQTAAGVTTYGGNCMITNVTGNTWSYMAMCGGSSATNGGLLGGGSVPLGAVLTAVRVTTINGTDTFDAGSINIQYE